MIERKTFLHQKFYHLQYVRLSDKAQLATYLYYTYLSRLMLQWVATGGTLRIL